MEEAHLRFQGWNEVYNCGGSNGGRRRGKEEIWRWKKQIFERKITVTAAQSRDRVNKLGLWGGWGCCRGERARERECKHETKPRDGAAGRGGGEEGRGKKGNADEGAQEATAREDAKQQGRVVQRKTERKFSKMEIQIAVVKGIKAYCK